MKNIAIEATKTSLGLLWCLMPANLKVLDDMMPELWPSADVIAEKSFFDEGTLLAARIFSFTAILSAACSMGFSFTTLANGAITSSEECVIIAKMDLPIVVHALLHNAVIINLSIAFSPKQRTFYYDIKINGIQLSLVQKSRWRLSYCADSAELRGGLFLIVLTPLLLEVWSTFSAGMLIIERFTCWLQLIIINYLQKFYYGLPIKMTFYLKKDQKINYRVVAEMCFTNPTE